jgi:hypothetical protein
MIAELLLDQANAVPALLFTLAIVALSIIARAIQYRLGFHKLVSL